MRAICETILFRNEENGYTVALLRKNLEASSSDKIAPTEQVFTGVGEMPFLDVGDHVLLKGAWNTHPSYGKQYEVTSCIPVLPHDRASVVKYLSSGVFHGIGLKLAEKIVDKFGEDTLDIIKNDPDKVSLIKGISKAKAKTFSEQLLEKENTQELFLLLTQFGFGINRIVAIYEQYGSDSVSMIKENPYRLADEMKGIGFLKADQMALQFGCDRSSPIRKKCALLYILQQIQNEGNTCIPLNMLLLRCADLLSEDAVGLDEGFWALFHSREIVCYTFVGNELKILDSEFLFSTIPYEEIRTSLLSLLQKELKSGVMLSRRLESSGKKEVSAITEAELVSVSEAMGLILADEQKKAVLTAMTEKISVITGGPGTGKTTIIRVILHFFSSRGKKAILCAPTGRAAKRLAEAADMEARTIHRLLEVERSSMSEGIVFVKNEDNPIETDVIVVDEVSMLDTSLFFHLLSAISEKTSIVFVGDQNQLPSVGPGNVLADLISSGFIKTTCLTQIFRQAEKSGIAVNAHRILRGEYPVFDQTLESSCMLVSKGTGEDIQEAVIKLCAHILPKIYQIDVLKDVAVLSPVRKGAGGVAEMNKKLQDVFCDANSKTLKMSNLSFHVGDKVMQTKNNYDLAYSATNGSVGTGVFNGETGIVSKIESNGLIVKFEDGRVVEYDKNAAADLDLAYAITVHKSQGSEYPVVILAISPGSPVLNNKNLLYTALTRAKKRIFVVSSKEILQRMIHTKQRDKRMTSLGMFLKMQLSG